MTSIIKLFAVSGVQGETPHCYILQVDEFRFLLDCGWDEKFSMVHMRELKKHIHQIDAVVLSYPDALHLGALPYVVGKYNLNCPIYSTIPTYKMGQMFMYDWFQSCHNTEEFDLFTLDDVDAAFDKIIQLKYSQTVSLKGKGQGLTITPLPAGHMIGGTIWKIVKDGEEDIIYAVDFNHKKERHLNGCILETLNRPSLLITDAYNATYSPSRRRQRDEMLMTNILQTLRNSGNVLIAVDTAGRVLELAHMLDQLWQKHDSGLMVYSLALLNNVSYNVVEFAKSQVEWMSDKIMRSFEIHRNNPFHFRHLQLCHSLGEVHRVSEPKVVLASMADMESGFSRELFINWCGNPKNSIILTSRTSKGTLARSLMENLEQKTVTLEIKRRVRLEGAELEEYMRKEKEKELEAARQRAEKEAELEVSDSSEESEDEMELDRDGKARHDLMIKNEGKTKGGGFFKQAKKSYPMFPVKEEKIKWDDYGEIIKLEDYMILDPVPAEQENKENKSETDESFQDVTEVPTKCISMVQTLDINASVQFIDFEGRSDCDSIRKILTMIKPRRLIIVRGSPEATESLASYCITTGIVQGKIFQPKLWESVDATTESHIYQVKLKDSLVSSLNFTRSREVDLAWLDGEIVMEEDVDKVVPMDTDAVAVPQDETEEKNEDEPHKEVIPILQPLPLSQIPGHPTIFINELKLSDFKQVLVRNGIQSEFVGGILYCNNVVAVKRNETGHIQFEGCLCEDYFKIRDLLYEQFAIV